MNLGSLHQPLHLSYCMNVHRGESLDEVEVAIREDAVAIKRRVCPNHRFGLGLRLGAAAVAELADPARLEGFRELVSGQDLYGFTVNGFPYGSFHGGRVKEQVYAPDWRTSERLDYTLALAEILAKIATPGLDLSISTVPGSYKAWITESSHERLMVDNLAECAARLNGLEMETGVTIRLGLEPEPGCVLEHSDEVVSFFEEHLFRHGTTYLETMYGVKSFEAEAMLRRYIGVCVDTCHCALAFEAPLAVVQKLSRHDIAIVKVQLSAALEAKAPDQATAWLNEWDEPVYLHQVRAIDGDGRVHAWADLPDFFAAPGDLTTLKSVRTHVHVPLFWTEGAGVTSTAGEMTDAWFSWLREGHCPHVETETYTYDVLPEAIRGQSLADMVARELIWAKDRILFQPQSLSV